MGTCRTTYPTMVRSQTFDGLILSIRRNKIRDFIQLASSRSTDHPIEKLLELEDWLTAFREHLPPALMYSKERLQFQPQARATPTFILLHSIFHQIRLILHASIVPQFSGQDIPRKISPSLVNSSAQIVVDSATRISEIASDLVECDIDVARLSPFTGHCMYIAATVHLSFLSRSDEKGVRAWHDIIAPLRVLKTMSPYWHVLQSLVGCS